MSLRATDLVRRGASCPTFMGILNVTPDSFSDGGLWNSSETAVLHAVDLMSQGAGIIDVGGESTRPGADPVSADDELSRLLPVLEGLGDHSLDVAISVDTMKAGVACKCVEAGASIINDVSGLSDPDMLRTAAELDVPIVIMSSYGNPKTFSSSFIEGDVLEYVTRYISVRIEAALDAGVKGHNIIIDPGLGFGMTSRQCGVLLDNLGTLSFGRYPVLAGPSRKRFLSDLYPGVERDQATAMACKRALAGGADILRVHDVACCARSLI